MARKGGETMSRGVKHDGGYRFGRITVKDGVIHHPEGGGPVAGARATVDAAGAIEKRITVTRVLLTGPLALAWRKKRDNRELYLLVEGNGFAFVEPVPPNMTLAARQAAQFINGQGSRTVAQPGSQPAGWHTDPSGRHELRFWDGQRWTEHVSDVGVATTDTL